MKSNFVSSLLGGAIGAVVVVMLLNVVGVAGAHVAQVDRSGSAQINAPAASPIVTSTFTYQGRLSSSDGSIISNTCDFNFSLYDAVSGGNQVGITQTITANVKQDLFTVILNTGNEFGDTAFNGEARWLNIEVRCPTGVGGFASLSPRQMLTALPFALPGLRTLPNATSPNIVSGYSGNFISSTVVGSVIAGGGNSGGPNGLQANYAVVGGGAGNVAGGTYATVPGGADNNAAGNYSFAAGFNAQAKHQGTFVWGDTTIDEVASSKINQFVIRASNGVSLTVDAGPAKAIDVGERYRDNSIIAWAKIGADGLVQNFATASFGVLGTAHLATGEYGITVTAKASSSFNLVPMAVAEVDGVPISASGMRIVSINQISANYFEVYINNGTGSLTDNDFVFMATGR